MSNSRVKSRLSKTNVRVFTVFRAGGEVEGLRNFAPAVTVSRLYGRLVFGGGLQIPDGLGPALFQLVGGRGRQQQFGPVVVPLCAYACAFGALIVIAR